MPTNVNDIIKKLPKARRKKIEASAAELIGGLGSAMYIGAGLILLLVIGLALYGVVARPRPVNERYWIIGGGLVFPVLTLSALLVYALVAAPRQPTAAPAHVVVEVVGHQWWWEVKYLDRDGAPDFTTANEIHIPVGRPVRLELTSGDVIHSFWVPNLNGKRDLVPGRRTTLTIQADAPGKFRGQCAEFCGHAHAQMALWVIAQPRAEFEAWRAAQLRPPPAPASEQAQRGQAVFMSGPCVLCHSIAGTSARVSRNAT